MLLLAARNLLVHKGRFLLAIIGITCSVVLVLFLIGLYAGWRDNMSSYLRHVHADVWVGQKGASDLFHTLSILPAAGESRFYEAEEVEGVASFVGRLMTCEVRGRQRHTFIVGVNDKESGPVRLLRGRHVENAGEIVIDAVFARKESINLGDMITVAGTPLQVVGVAQGGNCFLYQYAFVTIAQARQLFGLDGMVNYFLVQLAPHVSPQEAVTRIEQTSSLVSAYTKEQFIANNLSLTGDNFLPILRVLEVIGALVGAVIIGLTVYTLTVERSAEYGVLKAIGASDGALYQTVAAQALICGLCGWLLAVPSSWGVAAAAQYFVPQFPTSSHPLHVLWALLCTIGMSLLAALAPARRIAHIDPLVAFKG
jgi:putative ABC transport system permease protein